MPFYKAPEDDSITPPRVGDEERLADWNNSRLYEEWATLSDCWFIERDQGVIERSKRYWELWEFQNFHKFHGREERLKYLRYIIVKKLFDKKLKEKGL